MDNLNILNALSKKDKEDFYNYTNYYHSTHPDYLDFAWAPHKQNLFKLLNNSLIYKIPVNYEKTNEELRKDFEDTFFAQETIDILNNMLDFFSIVLFQKKYKQYRKEDSTFHTPWKQLSPQDRFLSILKGIASYYDDTFINNSIHYSCSCVIPDTNTKLVIHEKEKPFKFFSKAIKLCEPYIDKTLFSLEDINKLKGDIEKLRLLQSRLLNQKKSSGILNLSIHPLDYVTMSDNNSNWSSCMSWEASGCYRMGTLEMLSSPLVVVAYLERKNSKYEAAGITWNNKKWRELFIVHEDIICGVKGYPYQNDKLEKLCIKELKNLAEKNLGYKYKKEILTRVPVSNRLYLNKEEKKYFDFFTNAMYNDFSSSNEVNFIISVNAEEKLSQSNIAINYGDCVYCLECGSIITISTENEKEILADGLVCSDCRDVVFCAHCGQLIDKDDASYDEDGDYICEDCYGMEYTTCPICGEVLNRYNENNVEGIHLLLSETIRTIKGEDPIYYHQELIVHKDCLKGIDGYNCLLPTVNFDENSIEEFKKLNKNLDMPQAVVAYPNYPLHNVVDPSETNSFIKDCPYGHFYCSELNSFIIPREWIKF